MTLGWVRSRVYTDAFRFRYVSDILVIASLPNGLAWSCVTNAPNTPSPMGLMSFLSSDVWPSHPFTDESPAYTIQRKTWLGFLEFSATPTATNPGSGEIVMWYVPYWWPVSLLMVLSARLLVGT